MHLCIIGVEYLRIRFSIVVDWDLKRAMETKDIRRARIRQIIDRDFAGIDANFAKHIGRQPSYIARIFTARTEHQRNIGEALARTIEIECNLRPGFLDQPLKPPLRSVVSRPSLEPADIELKDNSSASERDEVAVPFLCEVELAAGSGRFAIERCNHKKPLRFQKKDLLRNEVEPDQARCVTARGNSMFPVLRDGAIVGINTSRETLGQIIDGDLYALDHSGQLRVKQLYRLPFGIRLRSFNRDEHPDETYSFEELREQRIVILGHVFWWGMFAR